MVVIVAAWSSCYKREVYLRRADAMNDFLMHTDRHEGATTLSGARWTGARWTGARWTGARWTGARWTGARWTGARWTGARWTGARSI
jgi:uncharacterized protein YjbI with pentapeptide repeats